MSKQMSCAKDIAKWLSKKKLTDDLYIYVDGARYAVDEAGNLVFDIEADPKEYLEFAGDFLSMSFEGPFYSVVNYNWQYDRYDELEQEFSGILEKYSKYYELGNAWNLSLYDI